MTEDLEPDPDEPDEDEADDDLPVKLPTKPGPSKFSQSAIDYTLNARLQDLIPKEANKATVSVRLRSEGEDRILTGVVATRVDAGKWDIGAALAASLDLNDTRNWSVEFLGVVSWE